jgi:hypothetical protein
MADSDDTRIASARQARMVKRVSQAICCPNGCRKGITEDATVCFDFIYRDSARVVVDATVADLLETLETIAGFGTVDLSAEWEGGLRDIIRSCVDAARAAIAKAEGR